MITTARAAQLLTAVLVAVVVMLCNAVAAQPVTGLQRLLDAELARFPGRAGVWVKHLTAGLQPTLRDVLMQMVITSDNTATDLAIAKVGGVARVNGWLAENGYADGMRLTQTTGELFAKYNALPQGADRDEKTNGDRTYSPPPSSPPLPSAIASQKSCEAMLRVMRAQQAGARRLPHFLDVPVAHKTGDSHRCWPMTWASSLHASARSRSPSSPTPSSDHTGRPRTASGALRR